MVKFCNITSSTVLAILAILISTMFLGCLDSEPSTDGTQNISITINDSNKTINAEIGDFLILELEENPTTGFQWELNSTDGLVLVNDTYIPDKDGEDKVGVGGTHTWTFKVSDTGNQQIRGVYKRPWENVNGDGKRFNLNIEVQNNEN
ncbi:MAG: protease inhibitor I42 family protein [Methanohalobium sp.]|uniref:protease inhibitor I42 family protein n=1 Tax=Methanohalobium sp. TaxID=2837493 RepID=UPI003979C076